MGVQRLLVSGPDRNRNEFHLGAWPTMNIMHSCNQTSFYTTLSDVNIIVGQAKLVDVTIQVIVGAGPTEEYPVAFLGSHGMFWGSEGTCVRCGSRYLSHGQCSRHLDGCQGGRGENPIRDGARTITERDWRGI